jgi:hypothetical protein
MEAHFDKWQPSHPSRKALTPVNEKLAARPRGCWATRT